MWNKQKTEAKLTFENHLESFENGTDFFPGCLSYWLQFFTLYLYKIVAKDLFFLMLKLKRHENSFFFFLF